MIRYHRDSNTDYISVGRIDALEYFHLNPKALFLFPLQHSVICEASLRFLPIDLIASAADVNFSIMLSSSSICNMYDLVSNVSFIIILFI